MRCLPILLTLIPGLTAFPLLASAQSTQPQEPLNSPTTICPMIEAAAQANSLPVDFFARLVWQESHFQPDLLGPLTRSGHRAEGIAQFMPATAAEHHLAEPFNPSEALPKSGEFLAQLRDEFGNLGLAAAAYNAGPQRVRNYLAGTQSLPAETHNYVRAITGRPVEEWAKSVLPAQGPAPTAAPETGDTAAVPNCRDLIAQLEVADSAAPPQRWVAAHSSLALEPPKRRVPSWCSGLGRPNVNECGDVHMREPAIKKAGLLARTELHHSRSPGHLLRASDNP